MEGRIKAIARGVKFGAKPKLTKQEIAEHYGIRRSSVYRLYSEKPFTNCLKK
ncbi:MAG: hypothetical protein AB7E65_09595 [Syntrophotalea sp.]|uniref:hypothetical protein n=1 Tax=Syntrophotalea sp. TaxID=2812029 RepID=UPI003D0ABFA6